MYAQCELFAFITCPNPNHVMLLMQLNIDNCRVKGVYDNRHTVNNQSHDTDVSIAAYRCNHDLHAVLNNAQ